MIKYIEILRKTELFSKFEFKEIETILKSSSLKIKNYKNNEAVFLSGTPAQFIGIVLSGQVMITKEDFYGNRNILSYINKGEIFGEAFACAETNALPISVFASHPSEILLINFKDLFSPDLTPSPLQFKLISNMLKIMAYKNLKLNQKIQLLSKRTTQEKLLDYLSLQAEKSNSNSFYIPFNRQELADYLSVDRSAMSAQLCKLRDMGILDFHKNHFILTNKKTQ